MFETLSKFKWDMMKYICSSKQKVYLPIAGPTTYTELAFLAIIYGLVIAVVLTRETGGSGQVVQYIIIVTVGLAMRNSILSLFSGIPYKVSSHFCTVLNFSLFKSIMYT
jgi:hypothetical protein